MSRRLLPLALSLVLLSSVASAHRRDGNHVTIISDQPVPEVIAEENSALPDSARLSPWVRVTIVDRDAEAMLPSYWHRGDAYVSAAPGHRYAVRLTNLSSRRVMTLVSVDGVNVMTGETAGFEQGGYILDPYETKYVNGWRQGLASERPFVFGHAASSYATRTHRDGNLGVIGVAVFQEDDSAHRSRQSRQREHVLRGASPRPRHDESMSHPGIARTNYSPAHQESFRRASLHPSQVAAVYYDQEQNLMKRGIVPDNRRGAQQSDPFPRRFVPQAPSNWQD